MHLALDVGNSQLYAGVFEDAPGAAESAQLVAQFRRSSTPGSSADEYGLFLRAVLRENGLDPARITSVSLASVVPEVIHSVRGACRRYFGQDPLLLAAGARTGLKIRYANPLEVGADRIANAIGGTHLYPGQNLIIVDYGTATTFDVVSSEREYLGGLILPGFRISMEALEAQTAQLPTVQIIQPKNLIGRSTVESIQAGLYYSNWHALLGISQAIRAQVFEGRPARVIGTGGFARLLQGETPEQQGFDELVPELVLVGLYRFYRLNRPET